MFSDPERAFFAEDGEIDGKAGLTEKEKSAVKNKSLRRSADIIDQCAQKGIRILTIGDAEYPERLRNIYDPPIVLYVKGRLPALDEEAAVGIVGTRKCTPYGITSAERLGYELAKSGAVVVTGLARGIDSAAAVGALRGGGKVVGILGCGADVVYPPENARIFEDVCAVGGLISEYPPGVRPEKWNFPVRNRIISGVSLGVLIIEAPRESGSLITASRALEQGRDVFALPGNVDAYCCQGSNELLKEGAVPVTCGRDIICQYEDMFPEKLRRPKADELEKIDEKIRDKLIEEQLPDEDTRQNKTNKSIDNGKKVEYIDLHTAGQGMSEKEIAVLKAIDGVLQADEIVEKTGIPAGEVLAALTMLEISGCVEQKPGKRFFAKVHIK